MTITTEKELGKALKEEKDEIVIEGDLTKKVLRIRATGKMAWLVALAAIALAVSVLIASGGTGAPASGLIGVGAVSVLGLSATLSAISIAVAAGGVGALSSLRKYREISRDSNRVVLRRN
jgi:hypothetical protein